MESEATNNFSGRKDKIRVSDSITSKHSAVKEDKEGDK